MTALLETAELTAGYGGAPVLHDIRLAVPGGEIVAVLGANGAGKTTLLRTLSGLLRPIRGRVSFDGTDLRGTRVEQMVRLGIAHVPEGRGVVTELTVDENLRLGGLWRRDRKDAQRALDEVYELFEPLARRRRHPGHQLSGGERQLLAVGRALVGRPRLLLLDEPSLGLAPLVIEQVYEILERLNRDGLAILLVEQSATRALAAASRGYVLRNGRIELEGETQLLARDPAFERAYFGFQP
jgi:branched-chain amino acid transport system ATP-binding protein